MIIRDPIHKNIYVSELELEIIDNPFFQRLRQIQQLGFASSVFPGATHTRFAHSLGAMHVAGEMFDHIFHDDVKLENKQAYKKIVRLGALCHDLGHAPMSHSSECAMSSIAELSKDVCPNSYFGLDIGDYDLSRQATHEDYTIKIILSKSFNHSFSKMPHFKGDTSLALASFINSDIQLPKRVKSLFKAKLEGKKTNILPILKQIISSELDSDRLDYLQRDSHFSGCDFGKIEYGWLLHNLKFHVTESNDCFMALSEKGLTAFEHFLLARKNMSRSIYHHPTNCSLEKILKLAIMESEYQIPTSLDEYIYHTDQYLYSYFWASKGVWPKRVVDRRPLKLYFEGSDMNKNDNYKKKFDEQVIALEKSKTPFLKSKSKIRVTKKSCKYDLFIRNYDDTIHLASDSSEVYKKLQTTYKIKRIYLLDL